MKNYCEELEYAELSREESEQISGGLWQAAAVGFGARALWEVLEKPQDFWEGFTDAFQ